MENNIYEVEKDDYKAFLGQLNTSKTHIEESQEGQIHIIKIISNKSNKHLCSRINNTELEEERYYIFNYPDSDERIAPKQILKINLDSREEVQAFFNAISKIQKEHQK